MNVLRTPRIVTLLLLFSTFVPAASALSVWDLTFEGGLHLLINTGPDSAPSPLLPGLGASLPLAQRGGWRLGAGLQFFGTWYQYESGRATPAEPEQRDFLVLAALGDLGFGREWVLNDRFAFGGSAGLGLLLRLPVAAFPDARDDLGPTLGYLYGRARFLYPQTGMYTRWKLSERFELRTTLRVFYPLFGLWDGEDLPWTEGTIISALLGLRYTPPAAD